MIREYDTRRGEIVQSHGYYYEIIDPEHENKLFDDYISAREYMYKYSSRSAFIARKEY